MRVAVGLIMFAACVSCASSQRTLPVEPSQRALYRDLERAVTVLASTLGWAVDPLEIDKLLPSALDSTCRVDLLDRHGLARFLDAELRRVGGPVEQAYRARGNDKSAVEDLMVLTRMKKLLARAEQLSLDCPFWVEAEHPFGGRQITDKSWLLSVSGGGKAVALQQGDRQDVNFAGGGRVLIGRSFANDDALFVGGELTASAGFPKDMNGERSNLVLAADLVVPVVYRYMLTNAYFEVDAGWLGHATERDWTDLDNGVHVGFAFGARGLRTRFVFPGAALNLSWERTFIDNDADITTIKIGARVSLDLPF